MYKNEDVKVSFFSNKMTQVALLFFLVITIWWILVKPFAPDAIVDQKHIWSSTYELLSILGGIFGVIIARYWGGYRSLLGKAILCFSIGLFLQSFGQTIYNYYTLVAKVEAPYPSIGDIGFFGSIPLYIYGTILLAKVGGVKMSLSAFTSKVQAIIIPLILLSFSYLMFLQGYQFDWSKPVQIFLDFGYPIGQAIYVSIAILVLVLSRNVLGGIMRRPIVFLLIALLIQYCSDSNFLYQFSKGTWYAGGWGDYLYAVSYFIMTMALIHMGVMFKKIAETNHNE